MPLSGPLKLTDEQMEMLGQVFADVQKEADFPFAFPFNPGDDLPPETGDLQEGFEVPESGETDG
jgi:hypothetical protein